MKKNISAVIIAAVLPAVVLIFSSCLKDNSTRTYKIFTPVYTKLTDLRAKVGSEPAATITNAGKLFISGNFIFLNEQNKGIHIIDNSNPARPLKTAFINIPGNIDMYVKGHILYADLYCDLLAIDIADPKHITVTKYLTNTFRDKSSFSNPSNPDSITIITAWLSRDTTVSVAVADRWNNCINCQTFLSTNNSVPSALTANTGGIAGSMARFAAVSNYLYAVTGSELNVIDINTAANPLPAGKKSIGWGIETIFPYNNKLYIGAASSMSVYDLKDPVNPQQLSWNGHWCSHDPIVADGNYAYVTLQDANVCSGKVNQLEIYNLATPNTPALISTYPLTHPNGLSKDGDYLFVCDDGLKIYDASSVSKLKMIKQLGIAGAYDVIAANGLALVVAKDGLYQYDYTDLSNIHLISTLKK